MNFELGFLWAKKHTVCVLTVLHSYSELFATVLNLSCTTRHKALETPVLKKRVKTKSAVIKLNRL